MSGAILVPLDGSALAERALPIASALAEQKAATLLLVHVIPRPSRSLRWPDGRMLTEIEQEGACAAAYLRQVEARLTPTEVLIKHVTLVGEAAPEIARIANEQQVER